MKKIISLIIVYIIFFISFSSYTYAQEKNIVNIYFFHSDTCHYCQDELKLLNLLEEEHENIRIYKYDISNKENNNLLGKVSNMFDVRISGVPFTIIGEKTFTGYSYENTKRIFEATIDYYSNHGYQDQVGKLVGVKELPTYPIEDNSNIDKYIEDYGNYKINIPIIGQIETKNLTLPIIAVLLGFTSAFNLDNILISLFLICLLVNIANKKNKYLIGITFLLVITCLHLLFQIQLLNISNFIKIIPIFKIIVALTIIIGVYINLNPSSNSKQNKKITTIIKQKHIQISLITTIILASSIGIITLSCQQEKLPIFSSLLSLNNSNILEYTLYTILYILCFFLVNIIILIIIMKILKLIGIPNKHSKLTKIISTIVLILICFILILKPELLILNM